ncbi:MAG: endo-1,4-beta-xylanase [Caulobacterales bacterium]
MASPPSRRAVLASSLALAACGATARGSAATPAAPLKSAAPFPVGTCVQSAQLDDPAFAALLEMQVSQIVPEWEMKMEYIAQPAGAFRFDAPDRIAAFARDRRLRLFCTALVWYAEKPDAFVHLDESRISFRDAFANYVAAVVGRYRGQAVGWDVVNEPIVDDGSAWRDSLWAQKLGAFEHMRLAFQLARQADPGAVLFLNDYNLERLPKKRATFMRLAEQLLKAGAPLNGLGTQTHVNADLAPGQITAAIKDLASLGLAIRVSEMDVSIVRARGLLTSDDDLIQRQAALYVEAADAFSSLPARQRFDFTFWGLRDPESWLVRENASDTPLPFDAESHPKPLIGAWEAALRR